MASSSSSSNHTWNHDVFLSFRGSDTRNTFIGHLYRALDSKGINAFIDNKLTRGEIITSQLLRVIEESRISIIVLSEKYASSSFCLDELVKCLECRESKRQTVIPVFYHVDPTDVEEQTGIFGQEFAALEAQLVIPSIHDDPSAVASFRTALPMKKRRIDNDEGSSNMKRVKKWRSALTQVARLSGWHLEKGDHEANIIQDIVIKVSRKLDYTPLHVAEHPVGLASRLEYILQKLNVVSHDVSMLGLHGMGGVGKTTTAAALYNTYTSQFEFDGSCFLSKVKEESKKHGIAKLQQTLLSEILGDQSRIIENSKMGIELIKRRLRNKKVLIVIDDVDHREQLQQLVGGLEWVGAGSIIIITTRDSHLLEYHGVTMMYEIKELEFDEALQLFSWYAFKEPQPDEAYMEISSRIITYAQGLPLALIVLGSSLYKRSAKQWDDMLKKLKRCPNEEINEVLKVSYDSLDSEEKAIFLDIVFFFKGKHKDEVTKFLEVCGFGAHIGIQRLVENSLVYVDFKGTLEMHDLLEAMGTKILLQEFSRLYIREKEEILCMFVKDKRGYDVEILVLDLCEEEEVPLNWLQKLTKLRALIVLNGRFKMPKQIPNSITWLEWRNSCLTSIPSGFLPPNLVVLEMPCSNSNKFLADTAKGQKFMNLTRIDFKGSKHLSQMVIDFSAIPNLEVLDLSLCENLKMIHKSLGSLEKLEKLKLQKCSSLTSLPSLVQNQHLQSITLSDCSNLENLPNLPTNITSLYLSNSGIKEIPSFIGNLINLEYIEVSDCKNLISVANSIYKSLHLGRFYLSNCPKLPQMPQPESSMVSPHLARIKYLFSLDFSRNKFVSLPMSIFQCYGIYYLCLNDCEWLVEIPELPRTLRRLEARNCKSLERFSQFQFDDYFGGDFTNCHKIVENEKQSWREMVGEESIKRKKDYNIILPGNEMPEWIICAFDCGDNENSFKLPSSLLDDSFMAIVCCAIFQSPKPRLPVEIQFSMSNFAFFDDFGLSTLEAMLESEHMWLGFRYVSDLPKLLEAEEISCKFHCDHEKLVLKRVGVHLIYEN